MLFLFNASLELKKKSKSLKWHFNKTRYKFFNRFKDYTCIAFFPYVAYFKADLRFPGLVIPMKDSF